MFDAATPTTELEAVNTMIATIGEQPIPTLTRAQSNADIQAALMLLRKTTRSVSGRAWEFNTDRKVLLSREADFNILCPANAVRILPDRSYYEMRDVRFVERRRRLYDKANNTFTWTQDLRCIVTWLFPFQELPEAARLYITVCAGRLFQENFEGSQLLSSFSADDEARALADMTDFETETANPNFLNDNNTVANTWGER